MHNGENELKDCLKNKRNKYKANGIGGDNQLEKFFWFKKIIKKVVMTKVPVSLIQNKKLWEVRHNWKKIYCSTCQFKNIQFADELHNYQDIRP